MKQNKFLTGFIAVMAIGVIALGYFLYTAKSRHDAAQDDYTAKAAELGRLQNLNPYPEEANLKQFATQKKDHADAIAAFQKNLAATQIPVEPLEPAAFQDKLREAVKRVVDLAASKSAKLPEKFYLGFDKYQTQPPLPEAAPVLGRQLKALELVLTQMLETGIVSLNDLKRDALPEEEGKAKKEPAKPAPGKPTLADKTPKELLAAHKFQVEFTSDQGRFRSILNSVVTNKTQFFIPRLVMVKNQKEAAPPKAVVAAVAPPADPAAAPKPPGEPAEDKTIVFGAEKVDVSLLLEMIEFAEVATK